MLRKTMLALALITTAPAFADETADRLAATNTLKPYHFTATRLIGAKIYNPVNETLGDVNDLVIGPDNSIVAVVAGVGGFLGVGEKNVAIPVEWVHRMPQPDGSQKIFVRLDKAMLDAAPKFDIGAPTLRQRIDNAVGAAQSKLQQGAEQVRETVSKGADKVQETYHKGADKVQDGYAKGKENVRQHYQDARQAIGWPGQQGPQGYAHPGPYPQGNFQQFPPQGQQQGYGYPQPHQGYAQPGFGQMQVPPQAPQPQLQQPGATQQAYPGHPTQPYPYPPQPYGYGPGAQQPYAGPYGYPVQPGGQQGGGAQVQGNAQPQGSVGGSTGR